MIIMFKFSRFIHVRLGCNINVNGSSKRKFLLNNFRRKYPNLNSVVRTENFHCSSWSSAKIYSDRENAYAFSIVENIETYKKNPSLYNIYDTKISEITTIEAFNTYLDQDFRRKTATDVFEAFKNVLQFCITNKVDLSDSRFDKLTDGLMDNVEKLTDQQLFQLLDLLAEFPECESFKSHNFHDIWSSLDDICCWRMGKWSRETQFFVAHKWYRLHLGKICDYIYELLDKLTRKAKILTKNELVHAFFYMNVCRKRTMDFEYEAAIERTMGDMNLDELAVVALGFFKSNSKVKISQICSTMIRKTIETENPHDMTLCAILKLLRFSSRPAFADEIYDLLEYLAPKLHKYTTFLHLHAALLGTSLQILHEPTLKIAAQRIAEEIEGVGSVRLKDIERILLPLTMFDYDPKTKPDIFEVALKELQEQRRLSEMIKHPRCMPCALMFLCIRGNYCYELMDKVLDKNFIIETYGRSSKYIPRDLYSLDVGIEIECPDYKGNRLDPITRYKAAKWLTSFTPSKEKKKVSKADEVYLKTVDVVSELVGGEEYYKIDHVLPQFQKADIIICKDMKTNKFVKPIGLENYQLGDVMRAPINEHLKWFSIVVIGWNTTIRNTSFLVGSVKFKIRHLNKIGYTPIPVIWNEFMPLNSVDQKQYILNKL